jgi:hypothetical protein
MFVDLAAGVLGQGEFFGWVVNHVHAKPSALATDPAL